MTVSLGPSTAAGESSEQRRSIAVSVVVPTRNRGDLIAETLTALLDVEDPGMEILVVDQSTDDATRSCVLRVAGDDPRVRVVPTSTVGSSAARNVGAQQARGAVIAYTDDDCIVSRSWLSAIMAEFADPGISAVFGRLVPYESGARTGREVGFKAGEERQVFSRKLPPWYIGHGGNMSFRRSALTAAGGFDPLLGAGGFFGACEDPDLAYRLLASGGKIVYAPDAEAYHKHWKDWAAQRRMERNYGIGAGAMFAKYVRCGDGYGARLAATWMWQLGVRRVGSGLLKWRSLKTMYLGYCQLVYPWVGALRSLRRQVDPATVTYVT